MISASSSCSAGNSGGDILKCSQSVLKNDEKCVTYVNLWLGVLIVDHACLNLLSDYVNLWFSAQSFDISSYFGGQKCII